MSILLNNFSTTEDFISKENFTIIRNDFEEVMQEKVLEEIENNYIENFDSDKFSKNREKCREAIRNRETKVSQKFENFEAITYFPAVPSHIGLIFRFLSLST